jgi:integrase
VGLGKQAKLLNAHQLQAMLSWLERQRHSERNRLIVLLSFKAGLRAKEIAELRWSMVMDASGNIGDKIHLTNKSSKGRSGRVIAMSKEVRTQLMTVHGKSGVTFQNAHDCVIRTQRQNRTSAQAIVNLFEDWYRKLGFVGCSSHSGRRTAITNWARRASLVGGSLRDVQVMAGHASLTTTSRYIESDSEAQRKLVNA